MLGGEGGRRRAEEEDAEEEALPSPWSLIQQLGAGYTPWHWKVQLEVVLSPLALASLSLGARALFVSNDTGRPVRGVELKTFITTVVTISP